MCTIRILAGEVDAVWKIRLRALIDSDEELEIVGETRDPTDLLLKVAELRADLVVLSQLPGGNEPGICSHLLLEHPNLMILLLPNPSGPPVFYQMILKKTVLHDVSKQGLLAALKTAKAP